MRRATLRRPSAACARTSASSRRRADSPGRRSSGWRCDHLNAFRQHEPGLIGIGTQPKFAIGQRALLVCTPHGNILWDCISLIDDATVTLIKGLGGLSAIAISHPHFYTTLVEWSRAFGNVPVHLHADDAAWVMRPDPCIKPWQGETLRAAAGRDAGPRRRTFPGRRHAALGGGRRRPGRGVLGRHRHGEPGPQVLHLHAQLSEPYPPVGSRACGRSGRRWQPFQFDRVYSHFFERVIPSGAKQILQDFDRALCRGHRRCLRPRG